MHAGNAERVVTLGQSVLPVDPHRAAAYDSLTDPQSRIFRFTCAGCGECVSTDIASYNGRYADPETVLGADRGPEVLRHFALRQDRSLVEGWPKLRIEACAACGVRYLVCVMEREPRNGWHQMAIRGITRIEEAEPGAA